MKSYKVEITETLRRTVNVEAHDYDEALSKVREVWRRSEYVLSTDDFLEAGFEVIGVAQS